ncbi:glycosyltransferase family 4 protein [Neobacillus muris]|uniref:glycosyltransferase family 4 protein n=1 Tax=Neobacillus muris TaxID=2941334 RepID=UPI00203A5626|nr:glycosyltransferase family 4 protein [Neobacillus muris]
MIKEKVLFLNQIPEVSNKYTFSLARALKKIGVDIVVCGIEDDDVSSYSDVTYLNYFYNYSKEKWPVNKFLSYRRSWERVVKYCLQSNVKIVHVQWYIFSPLDFHYHQVLRKHGVKVVTTIHDLLPFNKKFYDFHFHKRIYSHSDLVINQARMNEKTLVYDFGVSKEKIVYIPHGHFMEYAEKATKEESRNYLKLPENKKVILFFGQIKKVKGVDVLLKAMRKVADKHPESLCVIAGKVWKDDFSIYQQIIDELKIGEFVRADIRFIDDDEIKYYFCASDIVALPYLQIYQSGVVQLGYAYEKPIVATTEGEFLTVVKDKETGLLVKSRDPDQLADALCFYLDNPDIAEKYAKDGKKDIEVRLSWTTIGKQVLEAYSKSIGEQS